jgi:diguanylate cyclase (GGDEF)-like protein/PAS domain S-box-containing protein
MSGQEGLNALSLHTDIKVVVSDYMMPGMNGVEFLKRAVEILPDVVRIILTAHEESKVLLTAINEGLVYKFILKPWDDDDLKITIANAAERHNLVLQNRKLLDDLAASNTALKSLNNGLECIVGERTAELLKFETAIKGTQDWVLITDADGVITYANQSVSDISGYSIDAIMGQKPSVWKSGSHDVTFYEDLWQCLRAGQPFRHVFINKKADGRLFLLDNTINPIKDEQGIIKAFVSSGKDITQQKYLEDRLAYLAYYDPVTNMPNKSLFCDRLDMAIARIKHRERLVAIMIVGTDNFGMVIDTIGRDNADKILVELAQRLMSVVRDGDTVSRLGTNDFGLALNDIACKEDIPCLIDKVRSVIDNPIYVGLEVFRVSVSIGISICPDDAQTVQELMRNAYLSLSQARRSGGNTFKFYLPEMNRKASEFVDMERRLMKAIDNKGFVLHYQPYFNIVTGEIKGAESLLRLQSDDLGLIMPARFIHVLEETGLIVKAGGWVLEEVIAQLGRWQQEERARVPVTVNLSAVQFRTKDLSRRIRSSMQAAAVDPHLLSFEITESAFINGLDASIEAIDKGAWSQYID